MEDFQRIIPYLAHGGYPSILDDRSGFLHARIRHNDRQHLSFLYCEKAFKYNSMPFGWPNALSFYQQVNLISISILRSYNLQCTLYIDDRIVFSPDPHPDKIKLVVALCSITGTFLSLPKCQIQPIQKIVFLGIQIDFVKAKISISKKR